MRLTSSIIKLDKNIIIINTKGLLIIKTIRTKLSKLDKNEEKDYRILREFYSYNIRKFDKQEIALAEIRSNIQALINRKYFYYTTEYESSYNIIIILKNLLAPKSIEREQTFI